MIIYAIWFAGNNKEIYEDFRYWEGNYKYFKTLGQAEKWLEDEGHIEQLLKDSTSGLYKFNDDAPFHYIYRAEDSYYDVTYSEPTDILPSWEVTGWKGPKFDRPWTNEIRFGIQEIEVEE